MEIDAMQAGSILVHVDLDVSAVQTVSTFAQEESSTGTKGSVNPLHYIPSKPLAIVAALLYLSISVICILWCSFAKNPETMGLYIVLNLFTVLSPCAFIATAYMLLGRLALHLNADEYLLIKARIITKLFLSSDIVTLLIQAAGGSMAASASSGKLGSKIFLAGLIIQLISFIFYMIVYAVFLYRMIANRPQDSGSLVVSCIGILIRSVFRTVENAQGWDGYLATHEGYFYTLDTLPLFIAILVFVITWPPMYLTHYGHSSSVDTTVEMGVSRSGRK
ncbi:RTA1 like protein-domain-containing protein [Rhizoctonia solani]|nr:RTA1 like protein-domain-containing protein [Rhizoctonia solani]